MNILPESGKSYNTRASNGMHMRHTSRQLRHTFKDMNYKDLDVKPEEDVSPPCKRKREPSIAKRLCTPSFSRQRSQGIITCNRLQGMASPNTRARLLGTAIKIESTVKTENNIKKEPMVNTRRVDKSWPNAAKLVHLDRTPCSDECIANDHYGRHPDFPEDRMTELDGTPNKDASPVNEKEAADMEKNIDSLQELKQRVTT